VYEIANLLGIDAATLGNHEFDYGWKAVQGFARIARFPLLAANVQNADGKPITGKSHVILNVAGVRVAIVGLIMGDLAGTFVTAEDVGPWQVSPVLETVHRVAAELRGQADLLIALGHINEREAAQILADAPEISIVIAGHVHDGYEQLKQNGQRYAVEAKAYGAEFGRLDVKFDMEKHAVVAAAWKRIPVDSRAIAPAPDVAKQVAKWEAKVSHIVDVPVGEAKRPLSKADLRPLIEQAMAEASGADIAFITTGDVRATLPQGKLLARNIWEMLPFENHIVTGHFKGNELPSAITSRYPVEPGRDYKVAVTDFLAANQSSPSLLGSTGLKFPEKGLSQRDAMLNWVRKKKVLQ
jgi:2',3'-cyclic-nucleotide 2'-phosphodiesterase (5'-nucleotidase family)